MRLNGQPVFFKPPENFIALLSVHHAPRKSSTWVWAKQRLKQLQYVHRIELPTMAKCDRVKSGPWSCVRSKSINFSGPRESEIHRFAEI